MAPLEWVSRALMQPDKVQISLFPYFVNVADQLAIEWELAIGSIHHASLSMEQNHAIQTLDDYMASISGSNNIQFWDNQALSSSAEWETMRLMAKQITISMGWDITPPPPDDAIYIGHA